jgi:hypothetical protein
MTTAAIREKLHDFVNTADDKKVEAIYTFVNGEINDELKTSKSLSQMEKIKAMKEASNDPLFLADMKEISEDFSAIDHENI